MFRGGELDTVGRLEIRHNINAGKLGTTGREGPCREYQIKGAKEMNETTNTTLVPADYASALNIIEQQQAEIARLTTATDFLGEGIRSWSARFHRISEFVQASVDRDEWSEDELAEPFWEFLLDALEVETFREVCVEVTVKYSAMMRLPRGMDPQDYAGEIEVPDISLDSEATLSNVHCDDYSIEAIE